MPFAQFRWHHLRSLHVEVATTQHLDTSVFYQLTSLQDLSVTAHCEVLVTNGLAALSQLSNLTLLSSDDANHSAVNFYCEWWGMQSLQSLQVGCGQFRIDMSFLLILQLPSLKQIYFSSGKSQDDESARSFA